MEAAAAIVVLYPSNWFSSRLIFPGLRLRLSRSKCISSIGPGCCCCCCQRRPSPPHLKKKSGISGELCHVVWSVEADLAQGQLLYLTGDPIPLGRWNPDSAILMFPTQHHPNSTCWQTHLKVPWGTHFKYSYFIKDDDADLIRRPGPQFSLSTTTPNRNILIRDTWMTHSIPHYFFGSWLEDQTSFLSADEQPYLNDPLSFTTINSLDSTLTFSERDQPAEEPWLHLCLNGNLDSNLVQKEFPETSSNDKDGSRQTRLKDSVSTVILINSSVCTMQRIAILEDEKLVELLLEPVKNNVQCDSVYLGMITKLVPNMGGAFVNIGILRPSLMDIKHSREPFAFPPFRRRPMENDLNGLVTTDRMETNHNQPASHKDVGTVKGFEQLLFQDDSSIQFIHDDVEEHQHEDDSDATNVSKRNVNGSIMDYDAGVFDYDTRNNKNQLDTAADETDSSDDSQFSHHALQDMKDILSENPDENKWDYVRKGTKVIVQVVKEGLGTKGPTLTAYPNLRSRFWILSTRCDRIGVSKKVLGVERTRLRVIAKNLQPPGFGLTVRTVAAGRSVEELQKDLEGLLSTWKSILDHAKSAALAADEGVEGAVPVILHRAMGQTLSVAQDYFNEKVKEMIVDSPRTYHEITSYLQEIAPDLCDRVELYDKKSPIFDEYDIEEEINDMLSKKVPLANGGSLVIEQTEALVSIDVNGGHGMLGGQGNSQEKAILEVNLAAAKQIARELRLRDIGGIIIVDFIDMVDDANKRLVYEEVKKAVERDRSTVRVSELSRHGLMEITRKRVRPSVTFMISEPCSCCHATGRVEALETSFSKIEREICRLQATMSEEGGTPRSWPKMVLRVDRYMCNYLTSGKRTRLALLSSSLKVWILLKVARGFPRGGFELKPFVGVGDTNNNVNIKSLPRLRPAPTLTLFPRRRHK